MKCAICNSCGIKQTSVSLHITGEQIKVMTENIFSADGWLNQSITDFNDVLWTYIVLVLLIGCALWFSFKTRLVQVRMFPEMIRLLGEGTRKDGHEHISSFQAFAVSIASRVGTGNLAGVATAIAVGGPGAVF